MKKLIASVLAASILLTAGEIQLGEPLRLQASLSVTKILSAPDQYVGKTVQVKGKVTEVCQMMGCWMNLVDPDGTKSIRIKVNDGDIVFPPSSIGKPAIAEGKLVKLELTREQAEAVARHEAEEQGRKFDPTSIKAGATIYQVQGSGARILDK
ncbi:MAG: DUF4920 domain-containing protein [Bryobacteraceae bacterium]